MEAFFFWIFSIGMLLAGVSVILNRNPVASALSLVLSIIFMAGLFVMLHAFFLAAIQVLVYAGAVMVLFLFIIMLLDLKAEEKKKRNIITLVLGAGVTLGFGYEFFRILDGLPQGEMLSSSLPATNGDDVVQIGTLLFTRYLLPFEITSILLLVATVGVILLNTTPKKQ